MSNYNLIISTDDATVLAEYKSTYKPSRKYQTEAELEQQFIDQLVDQKYEYLKITREADLITNLRHQLEVLNNYQFTDTEWARFFTGVLASQNEGIVEKTRKIQTDHIQLLEQDDGMKKNIYLIDKNNIHNNRLQVINQYEEASGARATRYDVTILVNGLPLVHVELKRRGVAIREAFNNIKRYQRDSFWAASGLYEYIQIFIISNGTHTKYYSNTTRISHIAEDSRSGRQRSKRTSNSFEFTSYWADATNKTITDLTDFTSTFLAKHALLNILTRYSIFTAENLLLVMRPYQIAATEKILNRINTSYNYKRLGTTDAGGYIWHTTGSGKTLTSFKAAQLATGLPHVDKVVFVVDRKDLDHQTVKEYERFEKGAADSNTSTKVLQRQLEDSNSRIIITTIQKLDRFISANKQHEIYNRNVVLIFDECHRSQFGQMHERITKTFKRYHLFGFTGTPIFAVNAAPGGKPTHKTTDQAFGDRLHTYTIVDAINDGNVLPFRIDYIDTVKAKDEIVDTKISAIDREAALANPRRIKRVVDYILDHFDQKTKRNSYYLHKDRRVAGFNSIMATSSITVAKLYYEAFKQELAARNRKLNIAIIYSYNPNEAEPDEIFGDEDFDTSSLDQSSRDFLEEAIKEYNEMFKVDFSTSSDKFENYYKDLSMRVKNREIDLLIVVNMFLTGFDATTLNTLWVDKNLRQHGLIQAFSRTNRILNSVKTFGNIVCFRDLQEATDEAIAIFGDRDAKNIVLLKSYADYLNGYSEKGKAYPGYKELVERLMTEFPLGEEIVGEERKSEFIRLFGAILRLRNILTSFDDFANDDTLTEGEFQDYTSIYLDLYTTQPTKNGKVDVSDDLVFELELVRQVDVNIDYILMLVAKYNESNQENKEYLVSIRRAVNSSIELRSKRELIELFVEDVNVSKNVEDEWKTFIRKKQEQDLVKLIENEKLQEDAARKYLRNAFRDGVLKTTGTDLDSVMPRISKFDVNYMERKQGIIEKLQQFFEKYFGLV